MHHNFSSAEVWCDLDYNLEVLKMCILSLSFTLTREPSQLKPSNSAVWP
jgi:hypothetical protein